MVFLKEFGRYVTRDGLVYTISRSGKLKPCKTRIKKGRDNYIMVSVAGSSSSHHETYVHRLVALAFVPNPDNKPLVDHIDRDKSNCNASNLRWVTSSENGFNSEWSDKCFRRFGCSSRSPEYARLNAKEWRERKLKEAV